MIAFIICMALIVVTIIAIMCDAPSTHSVKVSSSASVNYEACDEECILLYEGEDLVIYDDIWDEWKQQESMVIKPKTNVAPVCSIEVKYSDMFLPEYVPSYLSKYDILEDEDAMPFFESRKYHRAKYDYTRNDERCWKNYRKHQYH